VPGSSFGCRLRLDSHLSLHFPPDASLHLWAPSCRTRVPPAGSASGILAILGSDMPCPQMSWQISPETSQLWAIRRRTTGGGARFARDILATLASEMPLERWSCPFCLGHPRSSGVQDAGREVARHDSVDTVSQLTLQSCCARGRLANLRLLLYYFLCLTFPLHIHSFLEPSSLRHVQASTIISSRCCLLKLRIRLCI